MFALDRQAGRIDGRWLRSSAAQLVWERILRDDPRLEGLVSLPGVARAAYQSWRRVHDYCIPLDVPGADDSVESAAFVRWSRAYRRLLDVHGWVDPAVAQSRVDAVAARPGIEMVGFDCLTPLQEALLARWSEAGVRVSRPSGPEVTPAVRRVQCLDASAEIEAAARWAARELDGRGDRRLAIVVADLARERDRVRRIVERVLVPASGLVGGPNPESEAFELAAARPLLAQPAVAAGLDLLDLFVRAPEVQALSRLLRNPFVAGAVEEADARARLDARLRRFEGPGLGLITLEQMAAERGCRRLATALAAGRSMISKWSEKDYPSIYAENVFLLLGALGWPGAAPGSTEHQAEQRWRNLVSELGGMDEFTGRVSRSEFVGLLRELASRVLFEPQDLQAPVVVIDPETCAGMNFDAVWVCGLDAARWPPPAAPDPFLPRPVQVRHGLPGASAELAAAESRRVFDRLLASAPEVILSAPQMEDDARLLASPLLAGLSVGEAPPQWPEPRLALAGFAVRPALESVVDPALPPIDEDDARRGGARLLELQAVCPFRAQAELRLGARALEEPTVGVDAAERGDLVHEALAVLWRELRDQATLKSLDEEGRRKAVQRAVTTALAEARRNADELMRRLLDLEAEWLAERVYAMLEADLERALFVVQDVEQSRSARIGELTLEMRPDRVDRLGDGTLAVIDYKTGASAEVKAWLDERPRLPQLPAYVQALGAGRVGAVAFARVRSGDTGYVGLAREAGQFPGLKSPGARGWPREFGSWDELLGAWRRRLDALAREYAAGDARLAPDPAHACEYCHLRALCRIAGRDAERPGEEAAGD